MNSPHAPPLAPAVAAATKPLALPEELFVLEPEERLELVAGPSSDFQFGKRCAS